jgi:hypothetical protein
MSGDHDDPSIRLVGEDYALPDGRKFARVTRVLREVGAMGDVSRFTGDRADFGTDVHRATELEDRRDLDELTVDACYVPYLDQWRRFKDALKIEIMGIERIVRSESLAYAGTLDRIIKLNGRAGILDIKTGRSYPWHRLQLTAYAMTDDCASLGDPALWTLYLDGGDGLPKLVEHEPARDEWISALCLWRWLKKHRLTKG